MAGGYVPTVVALETDLPRAAHVAKVVAAQSGQTLCVTASNALLDAVDRWFPLLILVDLETRENELGDWERAIRRCKLRPQTRQIPIYVFGSDWAEGVLEQARAAGADAVWASHRMMAELASVVRDHLHPPTRYPAGWDDRLSETVREGLALFNQGQYFEQHELLEEAWMAETRSIREMYQGILQIGVAFLQIEQNNWAGALKMFRRGLPKLRGLPDLCQGIHIGALRAASEQIHWELTQLGPDRLDEFDRGRLPSVEFIADRSPNTSQGPMHE